MTAWPGIKSDAYGSIEILKRVPLFRGLANEQLTGLSSAFRWKAYPNGSVILAEGRSGDTLFVLNKGAAKVTRESEDGREVILAFLSAGDIFGELSILDGRDRSANVIALEDTEVYTLNRKEFLELLDSYPALSVQLLHELARRIRASDQQIEYLALRDSESRVLCALGRLAEEMGMAETQSYVIDVKLPIQQDLANLAGTSRETVSRVLRSLEGKGMITRSVGKVQLHDFQGLQELSERLAKQGP